MLIYHMKENQEHSENDEWRERTSPRHENKKLPWLKHWDTDPYLHEYIKLNRARSISEQTQGFSRIVQMLLHTTGGKMDLFHKCCEEDYVAIWESDS